MLTCHYTTDLQYTTHVIGVYLLSQSVPKKHKQENKAHKP